MRGEPKGPIVLHPAERGEQILPVVSLDLSARVPAQQDELQRPRIGDVRCDVEEILARPPGAYRSSERIPLLDKCNRAHDWNEYLEKAPAKNGHESTERREQNVARLVENQVGQMQQRVHHAYPHRYASEL